MQNIQVSLVIWILMVMRKENESLFLCLKWLDRRRRTEEDSDDMEQEYEKAPRRVFFFVLCYL